MRLIQRFNRLTVWAKLGVLGSIASIIGLAVALFLPAQAGSGSGHTGDIVHGDKVGGDKVLGDKIEGNKIIVSGKPVIENHVLNNDGSPTLVLKSASSGSTTNPLADAMDPKNQVGLAPVGTLVKLLGEEKKTSVPFLTLVKVELLNSDLKGSVGWVSRNAIHLVREQKAD